MQIVLKLHSSGCMILVLSTNCAVRHLLYPQCHICHQRNTQMVPGNHQGEVLVKDGCSSLHTYGKKLECYGKTMEKLWNFFSGDLYEPWIKSFLRRYFSFNFLCLFFFLSLHNSLQLDHSCFIDMYNLPFSHKKNLEFTGGLLRLMAYKLLAQNA